MRVYGVYTNVGLTRSPPRKATITIMTYATVTGYPVDDYDGSGESFSKLVAAGADAYLDFAASRERTVSPGSCTGCGLPAAELIPWSGQRLCWPCTDVQLDLMAKVFLAEAPVYVAVAR